MRWMGKGKRVERFGKWGWWRGDLGGVFWDGDEWLDWVG